MRTRRTRFNRGIGMMAIYLGMSAISLAIFIIPKLMGAYVPYEDKAAPEASIYEAPKALSPNAPTQTQPSASIIDSNTNYRYSYEQAVKVLSSSTSTTAQRKAAHAAVVEHYGARQASRR